MIFRYDIVYTLRIIMEPTTALTVYTPKTRWQKAKKRLDQGRELVNGGLKKTGQKLRRVSQGDGKLRQAGRALADITEGLGSDVYFKPETAKSRLDVEMRPGTILLQTDRGRKTCNIGLVADHRTNNSQQASVANFGLVAARGGTVNASLFNTEGPDDSTNVVVAGRLKAGNRTVNLSGAGKIDQGNDATAFQVAGRVRGGSSNLVINGIGSSSVNENSSVGQGAGLIGGQNSCRVIQGLGDVSLGENSLSFNAVGRSHTGDRGISVTGIGLTESGNEGLSMTAVGAGSSGRESDSLTGLGASLSGVDGVSQTLLGVSAAGIEGTASTRVGLEYVDGINQGRGFGERFSEDRDKPELDRYLNKVDLKLEARRSERDRT